jgi:hypothetical protein
VLGLVWGIPTGAILGLLPLIGLILGAMAAMWLFRAAHRMWFGAGVLIGTCGIYLAALTYAAARCREFAESSPLRDCRSPDDFVVYQAAGAVILVAGIAILAVAMARARTRPD